ncbi:sulfite exporter TauE/SafE family protein [Bradyrhizobium sp. UFLA05-112]
MVTADWEHAKMPPFDTSMIVLAAIALFASFVNGALGYGFSSLTVPLALVFYTNRILNPAIIVIEVFVNLYVLFINLRGVPAVWKRVLPILIGLLPGIGIGAFALASLQSGWIKLATYAVILPLILVQAAGWRRPIQSRWLVGLPFGTTLGILYSVTTISGPPLAILFNNQGLVKDEFRAGLALVRVVESSVTALAYYKLGLFIAESANLLWVLVPCALIGIPTGAFVIRRLDAETFRRICMSFDAWVVGFGLSRVLIELKLIESPWAYIVMAVTILIDVCLLYTFFKSRRTNPTRSPRHWTMRENGSDGAPRGRISSGSTELPQDPLESINTLLGYAIGFLALMMLVHTFFAHARLFP